ncbi:MAG: leucine--tRNA ligase [Candidatus Omnitrophica bacterium]|nr:leucine--tRNA ligase [Candidatus Omnitrophota bacterium]
MDKAYPFNEIDPKWQKYWKDNKCFAVDTKDTAKKFYCLMMFPYPSAALHVGHGRNYIIGDVVARYKKMQGYNVLAPMGWDAFGLPAENAAIKNNIHPRISTMNNIATMKKQLGAWGVCYDWSREVASCMPDYYKWTQWIFLQLYKKGLAYKKKASVNWCSSCATVLANEQVVDGKCERCSTEVEQKDLEQWFFKITDYAERLLTDLNKLKNWPERVKTMQANWIGKSVGVEIHFPIEGTEKQLTCFTTRVDTIFGATYMVLAAEHPDVPELIKDAKNKNEILDFIDEVRHENKESRLKDTLEKKGVFTGRYVINPVNGKKIPLWIANYVLMNYGTGAVMAVPTHDQRDFEFAAKYKLEKIVVIDDPKFSLDAQLMKEAYEKQGILVNSQQFNGMNNKEAMEKIADWMEEKGIGKRSIQFKLRDWLISRQRYWGAPIPMVYCEKCGIVPVKEEELPVLLPETVEFKPTGESPLKGNSDFVNTTCPNCKGKAKREIDTMDTFVDSSWYFLRYISPKNKELPFVKEDVDKWLPVDQYIGGVEHAILHLLYSRFITKVLCDMEHIGFDEPFKNLFTQGMIIKDGFKMSKSKGNVVAPDPLIEKYGADTVRVYTLFIGPPEKDAEWEDRAVEGSYRFLARVWRLVEALVEQNKTSVVPSKEITSLKRKTHQTIKKVTYCIEDGFRCNTAISGIMELVNDIYTCKDDTDITEAVHTTVLLLYPFAPHVCDEMWSMLGNERDLLKQKWPKYDEDIAKETEITMPVQIKGKLRTKVQVAPGIDESSLKELVLNDEKTKNWIEGKQIIKWIIVPDKMVNIIIKD